MCSTALEVPGWYVEFQAALLRQAPRPGEMDQIIAESWTGNQESLKKNLASCLLPPPATVPIVPPTPELLLEVIGTVIVSATTGKFVAREKFVVNIKHNAPVKISYLRDNFTELFLSGGGKTEDPITEQNLRYTKLRKASVDAPIIVKLGGEEKSETTLSEMFSLLEKQGSGEDGVLLNNGYANIFYIKDRAGVLRTVHAYWDGGGWHVLANATEDPRRWHDGHQVFSRNSLEPSAIVPA